MAKAIGDGKPQPGSLQGVRDRGELGEDLGIVAALAEHPNDPTELTVSPVQAP